MTGESLLTAFFHNVWWLDLTGFSFACLPGRVVRPLLLSQMGWRSPAHPTPQIDSNTTGLLSIEMLGPLVTIACASYVVLDTALLTKVRKFPLPTARCALPATHCPLPAARCPRLTRTSGGAGLTRPGLS